MKRGVRRILIALGSFLGVVVVVVLALYLWGSARLGRRYEVQTADLQLSGDASSLARGEHLAQINGCTDCHGPDLEGRVMIDEPPFRVVASNLTSGAGGVADQYDARLLDRAIRHGVGADDRALLIMPSAAFHNLSDEDAAYIIDYVLHAPPIDNELPPTIVRPLGRILATFALDPALEVSLEPARATSPPPGPTLEYGEYLTSISCAYCHGDDLRGSQPPAPGSPPAPDLAAAGQWTEEQLMTTLRTGVTPGNRRLDPMYMPWPVTAQMTDDELRAIHRYLGSLAG